MRKIKFRAWFEDEMLSHENLVYKDQETHAMYTIITNEKREDGIVFMQYTGLKDKNGREIYEGDIIHRVSEDWDIEETYQVIWGGIDFPGFDVKPWYQGECNFFSDYVADDEWGTLEVIGNIYDNPELLEVAE